MYLDAQEMSAAQNYFLLIQTVIPRPIAWVLSDHGNGHYNLAPFSFFNAVSADPPLLMISVGHKDETTRKDTWVNIEERSHFVVHVPSVSHSADVVGSAESLAHGVSEIDKLKLELVAVEGEKLPRLKAAKIAFFCQRYAIYELGKDPQALILGEIKKIWIDDGITAKEKGRLVVDPVALDPLSRLGGNLYSSLGKVFPL